MLGLLSVWCVCVCVSLLSQFKVSEQDMPWSPSVLVGRKQ